MNEMLEMNRVEGFDPSQHLRKSEDGKDELYLDVKWRIFWFRKKYPNGKIDVELLQVDADKGFAVVQAKIYTDKSDMPELYLAKSISQRFRNASEYGDRFLEFAETAAIGRALSDAGFGTQFCTSEGLPDENDNAEMPVKKAEPTEKPKRTSKTKVEKQPKEEIQSVIEEKPDIKNQLEEENLSEAEGQTSIEAETDASSQPEDIEQPAEEISIDDEYQTTFEVETDQTTIVEQPETVGELTLLEAKNFIIDFGQYKDKKLGEVAILNPGYISWVMDSESSSTELKEAATLIFGAALAKLSD